LKEEPVASIVFPLRLSLIVCFVFALLFATSPLNARNLQEESPTLTQSPSEDSEIRSQLSTAEHLLGKTPDRAAVLYFIAASHALLREPHEAMVNLKQCVAAKEGFDPIGDPAFTALKQDHDFQLLTDQVHKDFPPVASAKFAVASREKDLIPEGLAYDSAHDVLYLSSMHQKKIVKISRDAKNSDFVPGDRYNLLPILGIRMDPTDGSVWSNSWLEGHKSELLHFDSNGTLLGRFSTTDEGKHGFNDLVVLRSGTVFLTDTSSNQIYRFNIESKSFQAIKLSRELLLPNGIASTEDEQFLYIADQLGVLRLDVRSGESTEVSPGPHSTLAGADGLYWHKGSLIAVQNGIGSPRIAAFQLSNDGLHVYKTIVLENRSAFTVLPTTGALRGNDFYFIANSQLDNLNGDRILDVTRLEPVRIAVLTLP
jgi:SMP-30/Gluconolactonase/LRE-like region